VVEGQKSRGGIIVARPEKTGMDYFPHDTDAVTDEKIDALRMLYGNDGYAFYFIMLERIYRTPEFELDVSDTETRQVLARKIGITEELFDRILLSCIKRSCFDRESYEYRGVLTSPGIKKRAYVVLKKRENAKKSYSGRVSVAETGEETRQEVHKEKKRKEKESKEKESKEEVIVERINYSAISEKYNTICKSLPAILQMTDARKRTIKSWNPTEQEVVELFQKVASSDFLTGKKTDFTASFDWIIKPANRQKIIEGQYDNKLPQHETSRVNVVGQTETMFDRLRAKAKEGTL